MQGLVWQGDRPFQVHDFPNKRKILPEILGSLIAKIGFGVILTTAQRRIVYVNDKAEAYLRMDKALRYERNRLSARDIDDTRQLVSLIFEASRQSDHSAQAGTLLLREEEGEEAAAHAVHVLPLGVRPASNQPTKEYPCAGLILVRRPAHSERLRRFADLFALTAAETRVAAHLIEGSGVLKAAARLNISPTTVRTHLTSILRKTGASRQAELVKIFYEVTLPGLEGSEKD